MYDAVVVGSGPNGFAAAIGLAKAGWNVCLYEGRSDVGGGVRSAELTLPGFIHDVCSAFHPLGLASPFFRSLDLERHGLRWAHPTYPLVHPLPDGNAAVLHRSVDQTAAALGRDEARYRRLLAPLVANADALLEELLGPARLPGRPFLFARFGLRAMWPATFWTGHYFREESARALIAGNAAHAFLPLSHPLAGAVGLMLAVCGHAYGWPVAQGGSGAISRALRAYFEALGGSVVTNEWVQSLDALPPARAVICDVSPRALATMAGDWLPESYKARLNRYRHGPAAFKVDWALDGPVPWLNPACAGAGTLHVGGRAASIVRAERATFDGTLADEPFMLVGQQSTADPTRAPAGQATLWAYAHVPHGFTGDLADRVEAQIERLAPGFRQRILRRAVMSPADLAQYNPNYRGGDIVGGIADVRQLFHRPVSAWRPYETPNPRLFLCSASTPPGAGVHGMCGWHAAQAVLRQYRRPT